MCGIAGCVERNGTFSLQVLKRMCDALRHRGPDDEGYVWFSARNSSPEIAGGSDTPSEVWSRPTPFAPGRHICDVRGVASAGLGHRRLAIVDLTASGHQPMCDA